MPADRIVIANRALGLVGGSQIQSFEEGSTQAELCKEYYDSCVGTVLEDHDWRFAEEVATPAPDAVAKRPDFAYSYQLPRDCLVVRGLLRSDGRRSRASYRISGRKLCTDDDSPRIVYTRRAPEHFFTEHFTRVVVYLLAHYLCGQMTGDTARAMGFLQTYQQLLAGARARDSQQDTPLAVDTTELARWHTG